MRVQTLLGFAQNAGQVISGSTAALRAIGSGKARLVVVANDAAPRTKKRVSQEADAFGVPVVAWGTMATLGRAVGKPDRAVVVVCDSRFARSLAEAFAGGAGEKG